MGKFDGILIATDWDGTFFSQNKLYEKNLEAIRYFQENGGMFTICTGRYYDFFKQYEDRVNPNTYVISYGGAYVVEPKSGEVLYEGFCDPYVYEILERVVYKEADIFEVWAYSNDSSERVAYTKDEFFENLEHIKSLNIYKFVIKYNKEDAALEGMRIAEDFGLGEYIAVRSWSVGLEFLMKKNAKGAALRKVADKVGARLSIGVGDYENDIEMIKDADIGYAVANACDALKAVADRVTVSVSESAIAAIIEDVEKEFCI